MNQIKGSRGEHIEFFTFGTSLYKLKHPKVPQTKLVTFFCVYALPHSPVLYTCVQCDPFPLGYTLFCYELSIGKVSHKVETINASIKMRELLVICAFTNAVFLNVSP